MNQRYGAMHQMVTSWLVQRSPYCAVLLSLQSLRRGQVGQWSCILFRLSFTNSPCENRHFARTCVLVKLLSTSNVQAYIHVTSLGRSLSASSRGELTATIIEVAHRHEKDVMYTRKDCLRTVFVTSTKSPTWDHPGYLIE